MDLMLYQGEKSSCLFSCIKMMLAYYFDQEEYAYLKEPFLEDNSPSLLEGIDYAKKYGLELEGRKVFKKEEILKNATYPLILLFQNSNGLHAVFLKEERKGKFIVYDPDLGKRKLNKEELLSSFSGVYLVKKSLIHKEIELPTPKKNKWKTILDLLPLVYFFSYALAYYSFSKNLPIYVGIIFFTFGILFFLLGRILSNHALSSFDKNYSEVLNLVPIKQRKSAYFHYSNFKGLSFSLNGQIFLLIGEIVFFICILSIENIAFLIGFIALFLFLLPLEKLKEKMESKVEKEMSEKEESYYEGKSFPKQDLSFLSRRLVQIETLFEGLKFFFEILCGILSYLTLKRFVLYEAVFYLLPYFFFGEEFLKLISYPSKRIAYKKEESYFNSHFVA